MRLTRRELLVGGLASVGSLVAGCTQRGPSGAARELLVQPLGRVVLTTEADDAIVAEGDRVLQLAWRPVTGAELYDVELNGSLVASQLTESTFVLGFGDRRVPFTEGANRWRVRARGRAGERWSAPGAFDIRPSAGILARRFDLEETGELRSERPSVGTTLAVTPEQAFGGGKALHVRCTDPRDTRAYVDQPHLPVEEAWLRLAVLPGSFDRPRVSVAVAALRSSQQGAAERLVWETGREIRTTSIPTGVQLPAGAWVQVQFGVRADGTTELWAFDGRREFRAGQGRNDRLRGAVKDGFSLGNHSPNDGIRYDVWIDEVAAGERRLPWAHPAASPISLPRLRRLDPHAMPDTFSFVFGSCHHARRLPNRGTALEAAARFSPDFVVHLGDLGYPDVSAYTQSTAGYLALWSDVLFDEQLSALRLVPWIYLPSDHDLGGNDVDRSSTREFALRAVHALRDNDTAAHPQGSYGSALLAGGLVLLVWLDTVRFRTPLAAGGAGGATMLGGSQRRWLLETLAGTKAGLVIIASQAPFGHSSPSGWARFPVEQHEVLDACQAIGVPVRFVTADHHSARFADLGDDVAEWGAAPLNTSLEDPLPGSSVARVALSLPDVAAPTRRADLARHTSFGRVAVDARRGTARFEIRDFAGNVRVHPSGFRMAETVALRDRR